MNAWTTDTARTVTAPEEVHVAVRRADGTLRRPRIIWIVRDGDRVFVRSTNGRGADWFRSATASGAGQIIARETAYDVLFTEVHEESDLAAADVGYRTKYGHYASIVDHLEEDGPRAATLEVHPA
ncbi:hypothetical protein N865_20525 [Intrasporangium oryzae NRRL B-24470]|uniref:DUF2255 family protein n=1 Tax=Intrasporangium oryzae NRRL B-24470 TaxID=1386089 RepID=W9GAZ8_9MICO|nr:DUF2255 family protein [Intrasporangium oryzae]EWT01988.1 hypothetical protein N865_20525 [Intrasporangium oryzae NRRL B-24470]